MSIDNEKIIDGRAASDAVKAALVPRIEKLKEKGIAPGLATIIVGEDPASKLYVSMKHKACKQVGIASFHDELPASSTQADVESRVFELNNDERVHGILVQVPLPGHLDAERILLKIDPAKDVDGFHPYNLGQLLRGNHDECFVSCTPAGIMYLLQEQAGIDLTGKDAVIVGRSAIVGKPMVPLLLSANATVTTCHSKTGDLKAHVRRADVVVAAVGRPKLFTREYFKSGAVVIDVGINRTSEGLCGDVDFEGALPVVSKITPVPGGVGPMTIAMLLSNTVKAAERKIPRQ